MLRTLSRPFYLQYLDAATFSPILICAELYGIAKSSLRLTEKVGNREAMDEDLTVSLGSDAPLPDGSGSDASPLWAQPLPVLPAHQGDAISLEIVNLLLRLQSASQAEPPSSPIVHGPWTPHEDGVLTAAVGQLGSHRWTEIARFVPTRTSKQCRERWFDRLAPGIRREPFAPWEDRILIESQREIGNHWSRIAQRIPGRSAAAVKNRWYSGLRSQPPPQAQIDIAAMTSSTGS
jgi:hypothetical protein